MNIKNYLTIEAREDGLTASLSVNACEYCVDGDGDWKTLAAGTATEAINAGQTLSFRGELTPTSSAGIGTFTISKKCDLNGNCMSMLFKDNAANNYSLNGKDYAFYRLFYGCKNLGSQPNDGFLPATTLSSYCYYEMFAESGIVNISSLPAMSLHNSCYRRMFYNCKSLTFAPELPATTLTNSCYYEMFSGCTNLATPPKLPATTLDVYCYRSMFQNCKNLRTAPKLPATSLAYYCYQYMFSGCTSLTTAPELPATSLTRYCYSNMFNGCKALINPPVISGTSINWATNCCEFMFSGCTSLITAPTLPAITLGDSCYYNMFSGCTALTTAPELPATTLASRCYAQMFYNCTSLTTAPELPVTTLASYCYVNMFCGCTSLTTAPELPATTLVSGCYSNMFYNCTNLTTAPELPATTLATNCYEYMFCGCSKLNYIKMLATNISASSALRAWVNGVASTGTFVKHPDMTSLPTGASGIPSGWTVVNSGDLITFTIDGTEYQAEEGMTWGEWVDSEYNVINASIYTLSNGVERIMVGVQQGVPNILFDSNFDRVITTQEITINHSYHCMGGGGN